MRFLLPTLFACWFTGCAAEDLAATEDSSNPAADEAEAAQPLSDSAVPNATCALQIGTTSRSGDTITGFGSQSNCGVAGTSTLFVQRTRAVVGWESVKSATVTGSGHDVFVHYDCSGTGTHTFRTVHEGTTINGTFMRAISNSITATCN